MQIQIDKQTRNNTQEQDKSSDIEQQSSFGDRKESNTLPQMRGAWVGGATKSTGT